MRKRSLSEKKKLQGGSQPWGAKISAENFMMNHRWRWSPWRFLVDSRWHHLSSSQWTSVSTLRAEGRNISNYTEIYWCCWDYSHWIWMCYKTRGLTIVGMSIQTNICQISWRLYSRNLLKGYMWSGERLTKIQTTTRPDHVWPEVWPKMGQAARNRENRNGQKKNWSSTMLGKWKELTLSIHMTKNTKKFSRMRRENWRDLWDQPCHVKGHLRASGQVVAKVEIASEKNSRNGSWVHGGTSWIHETTTRIFTVQKKMKTTLQATGLLRCLITIWLTNLFPFQAMKIADAEAAVVKERDKLESCQPGKWPK